MAGVAGTTPATPCKSDDDQLGRDLELEGHGWRRHV
jgi:hypothetical protein